MKGALTLIMPCCPDRLKTGRLNAVLEHALAGVRVSETIETAEQLHAFQGEKLLFAVPLGVSGVNLEYYRMLQLLRMETGLFQSCMGALLVDGLTELYTKSVARELVFAANTAGCAFIGRPLVEGTISLANFQTIAGLNDVDHYGAYLLTAKETVARLLAAEPPPANSRRLLVLHASSRHTSNTFALWGLVKEGLPGWEITEIGLRNGEISDCSGCPYSMCLHFGDRGGCFYGGVITKEVYPAVLACDRLLLLCPNYNDALSANISAFINRLTALTRTRRFYEKSLYALIVSGYSGSDIIAGQLIAGLNMNKSFYLPPRFAMLETANDPGAILKLEGIEDRARAFARRLANVSGEET